jgi:hypothetical protein
MKRFAAGRWQGVKGTNKVFVPLRRGEGGRAREVGGNFEIQKAQSQKERLFERM